MRKVVIAAPGGHERLTLVDTEMPRPAPGEVRIAVTAIGVNYADCVVRMGLYASAEEFVGWPITPGFEVAGVVDALGEGVTDLAVGAEVIAVTRFGGYATALCVPVHQVFAVPPGLSLAEAAAVPAVYLTAWYALHALAHARAGESVLVHSAAGGVGGALCQFARRAGCRVIGVVGGPHKVAAAQAVGADVVIDKSRTALWPAVRSAAPDGVDVACDANGPETLRQSYRHLAAGGRLIVYGFHTMLPRTGGKPNKLKLALAYLRTPWFSPLALTNENRGVLGFNLSYMFHRAPLLREGMAAITDGLAAAELRPPPVTTYPLDQVAQAHRDLESGRTVGKLVLLT
ncbi:synaptic vesicle VAT-1 family membrane protein [Nannocystis radixulma]|uniref:Medium chain dehydrogenase/reductase family protein n=1 Tax=Nannocystis radixulma TaxID=2995305 RepID=A0ABT5BAH4_9BACT|nr:medium chain dehydrogenase/reductase family protein [Nannocystis radixulma]MDC0671135.1 medium chain dehydrogenase/reductase family protein [Nannocystis radixulma]